MPKLNFTLMTSRSLYTMSFLSSGVLNTLITGQPLIDNTPCNTETLYSFMDDIFTGMQVVGQTVSYVILQTPQMFSTGITQVKRVASSLEKTSAALEEASLQEIAGNISMTLANQCLSTPLPTLLIRAGAGAILANEIFFGGGIGEIAHTVAQSITYTMANEFFREVSQQKLVSEQDIIRTLPIVTGIALGIMLNNAL